MQTKRVPLRKCLGCNEMKPKKELVRVVKNNQNEISMDLTGKKPGRGAYICRDTECLKKAVKRKGLERAFSHQISDELFDRLKEEMNDEQ